MRPYRLVTLTKRFLNAASLARSLHEQGCWNALRNAVFLVDQNAETGGDYLDAFGMFNTLSAQWPTVPMFFPGPVGPFNFSKSANHAIRNHVDDHEDILLVNDDTVLLTEKGTDRLAEIAERTAIIHPELGLLVPAVNGLSSARDKHRDNQSYMGRTTFPFIWAYIPAKAWREVGPLDERFDGYGWEDEDWQQRAFRAGYITYKTSEVRIEHLPPDCSTFRSRADWRDLEEKGRARFQEKWEEEAK